MQKKYPESLSPPPNSPAASLAGGYLPILVSPTPEVVAPPSVAIPLPPFPHPRQEPPLDLAVLSPLEGQGSSTSCSPPSHTRTLEIREIGTTKGPTL